MSAAGIPSARIALDPGFGFGKTVAHNETLLRDLAVFHGLGCELAVGLSRKSFIHLIAAVPDAAARLPGTLGCTWELLNQGVMLHRLHDVAETRQALAVRDAIVNSPLQE